MDSPLLPRLRGNVEPIDETFGDMSLLPPDSPEPSSIRPPPSQLSRGTGTGSGMGSLFNRPRPTRQIEETPESKRTISGGSTSSNASASSSRSISQSGPRFSLFAPKSSQSSNYGSFGTKRQESGTGVRGEEEEIELEEEEEEEGDRTVTIEQEDQTPASRAAREERLKDSLYELRSINDTFEIFLDALESARGHNVVCGSYLLWAKLTSSAWQQESRRRQRYWISTLH
jgi:hypothetical protein